MFLFFLCCIEHYFISCMYYSCELEHLCVLGLCSLCCLRCFVCSSYLVQQVFLPCFKIATCLCSFGFRHFFLFCSIYGSVCFRKLICHKSWCLIQARICALLLVCNEAPFYSFSSVFSMLFSGKCFTVL